MRIFLILLLLLNSNNLFSQVKIEKIIISKKDSGYIEKYYVLKTDKSIKQGSYKKIIRDKIAISGQYDNNIKVGKWDYYNWDGTKYLTYDYSINEPIFFKQDNGFQIVIMGNDTLKCQVERPVLFKGSIMDLGNLQALNMRYPESAANQGIKGNVYVGLVINKEGGVENIYIVAGVNEILNKEAIRVVKETKGEWIPAIYKGQKVKSVYIEPIKFILE